MPRLISYETKMKPKPPPKKRGRKAKIQNEEEEEEPTQQGNNFMRVKMLWGVHIVEI